MSTKTAESTARVMPNPINLGRHYNTSMGHPMLRYREWVRAGRPDDPLGRRMVMGFALPVWQRPLVWDVPRQTRFLESAWLGLNLGTYTYNEAPMNSPYDNLLIDGQQRMWSIQQYLDDEFPVFGYFFSEITEVDERAFTMSRIFASYVTQSEDEDYLRSYYDMMNFGGVAHTEAQRATRRTE